MFDSPIKSATKAFLPKLGTYKYKSEREEDDIQNKCDNRHGQRYKIVDHHRKCGAASDDEIVRHHKKVDSRTRKESPKGDDEIFSNKV